MKTLRRMKKYRYGGGNLVCEERGSTHLYFVRNVFFQYENIFIVEFCMDDKFLLPSISMWLGLICY